MLPGWLILATSFGYLCLLFAIAYYGDKRADQGHSLISNPYIYALSIAVYCTSWTFYGSVGRAASSGVGFLPIYLGPTLMFALGWFVIRKMIRISKVHRITSIADFISSRYGKSHLVGGLVTVIAVIGIMPYVSLQLKAVSTSFDVLVRYPEVASPRGFGHVPLLGETALYVALAMAVFAILYGTRHIDATEHHEGMVAAIAFESVVKLIAFMSVGVFVTFRMFDGVGDLFAQAAASPALRHLMSFEAGGDNWVPLTILSMMAVVCLPRQFQMAVVENVDESHLNKAIWLFPLYLFAINVFVLPIAFGGLLTFQGGGVDADTYVLALPMAQQRPALALFAYVGGLSAATAMVIVATIALSTMICNDLIVPVLLRVAWLHLADRKDLSGLFLNIRRGAIVFVLALGYLYFHFIGGSYTLVTIGLVSFVAAAQFAPAIFGGIYWKGATRRGAIAGLSAGFLVWIYTLLLPGFARSGWLPADFITNGAFELEFLKPYALFGLKSMGQISHAMFWSMLANIGAFVAVSLIDRPSPTERIQATLFVEIFRQPGGESGTRLWRGSASVADLRNLVERFLGRERTRGAFADYARRHDINLEKMPEADGELVQFAERLLAGAIGAASARAMVASVIKGEGVSFDEIMQILDETSQVLEYSRQLEQKSKALEDATAELQAANERLKELDQLKDEFLSTVTHELRTPLTSVRSFSEILYDTPDLKTEERQKFLGIIIRESERLTRLINQVLDLTRIEAGRMEWQMGEVDLKAVVEDAVATLDHRFKERSIRLETALPDQVPAVTGDRDQLMQVVINLLSNAEKFCRPKTGKVLVSLNVDDDAIVVSIADNGPGIATGDQELIFEKFHQVSDGSSGNPMGSGLGLAISRKIVEYFGGRIWVESDLGKGATFYFTIPTRRAMPRAARA